MTDEKRYRIPDPEYYDGWREVSEEEYNEAVDAEERKQMDNEQEWARRQ